jgi:hypothetical protein
MWGSCNPLPPPPRWTMPGHPGGYAYKYELPCLSWRDRHQGEGLDWDAYSPSNDLKA